MANNLKPKIFLSTMAEIKAVKKVKTAGKKLKVTTITAITTAIGFTIALFWRDAVKSIIDEVLVKLPLGSGWLFSLIAAVLVTILGSLAIWSLAKWEK